MTDIPPVHRTLRERFAASRVLRRTPWIVAIVAVTAALSITLPLAFAPPSASDRAAQLAAYAAANAQGVEISPVDSRAHLETIGAFGRDGYEASEGIESLVASGTNHDWAKMVLLFAGFPMTDDSVTVITRWMRQENYVDSWWNRNNPLNNGWGASYGPGGTGSNVDLVAAARNAADALLTYGRYAGIREAFQAGADSATIEAAIWASPWASGHYNNGAHWHYTPVPVIKAPASAWGQ